MMKKFTLITGASAGIGQATAREFASHGKNLILVARRLNRMEELKIELTEKYNINIHIVACDLSHIDEVYKMYEDLKGYHIETWINNAGLGHSKSVINQDLQQVSFMMRVNMESLTILSTLYARDYQNVEGATLINVSSTVGYGTSSKVPTYSATKFFASAFTEGLFWEMQDAKKPLRVKTLAPAATMSEFGLVAHGMDVNYPPQMPEGKKMINTSEELGEFTWELYESDYHLGWVDYDDEYVFKLSNPRMPHSFTKAKNPNLLKSEDKFFTEKI